MSFAQSPQWRRWGLAVTTALALLAGPVVEAAADEPSPSPAPSGASAQTHGQLRDARDRVRQKQSDLEHAQRAVASAHADLTQRAELAEKAIARYAATMKRVNRTRQQAVVAQAAAAQAAAETTRQEDRVHAFARAAYISGGPMTSLAVVLDAGDPSAILKRAALLGQISQSQATVLDSLADAQEKEDAAAALAATALMRAEGVAARADKQRRGALVAMANQEALLQKLSVAQSKASERLARQQVVVAELAAQRAAARRAELAAQRAALAAAWTTMQNVGDTMPWATARQGRQVVRAAKEQLGVPYSWGGGDVDGPTLGMVNENGNPAGLTTKGFDCSGLTLYAWNKVGFSLDHYTGYQWVEGHHIDLADLRAGDLVFFAHDVADPLTIHHVGIYVGRGRMIDAPHTGAVVRYDKVFVPGLIGAVRP